MTKEEVSAVFLLAGFTVEKMYEIKNEYSSTRTDPWWLVKTKFGLIKIGWRKRVINIDWEDTGISLADPTGSNYDDSLVTHDQVTKWEFGVHAYGIMKATEYLRDVNRLMESVTRSLTVAADLPPINNSKGE